MLRCVALWHEVLQMSTHHREHTKLNTINNPVDDPVTCQLDQVPI